MVHDTFALQVCPLGQVLTELVVPGKIQLRISIVLSDAALLEMGILLDRLFRHSNDLMFSQRYASSCSTW